MTGPKTNEGAAEVGERVGTRATAKYVRGSATKARQVLDLIRGSTCSEADDVLRFAEREMGATIRKVLASAVANAEHNDSQGRDELYVAACFADEGPTLRRFRPAARGRATRVRKRTCHITIIVARMSEEELERKRRQGRGAAPDRSSRRAGRLAAAASRRARVAREPPGRGRHEAAPRSRRRTRPSKRSTSETRHRGHRDRRGRGRRGRPPARSRRPTAPEGPTRPRLRRTTTEPRTEATTTPPTEADSDDADDGDGDERRTALMGQKVNPYGFRLGVTTDWKSRWFCERDYKDYLTQDWKIRRYLMRELESAVVSRVDIERTRDRRAGRRAHRPAGHRHRSPWRQGRRAAGRAGHHHRQQPRAAQHPGDQVAGARRRRCIAQGVGRPAGQPHRLPPGHEAGRPERGRRLARWASGCSAQAASVAREMSRTEWYREARPARTPSGPTSTTASARPAPRRAASA